MTDIEEARRKADEAREDAAHHWPECSMMRISMSGEAAPEPPCSCEVDEEMRTYAEAEREVGRIEAEARLLPLLAQAYRVDEPDVLLLTLISNEDAAWRRLAEAEARYAALVEAATTAYRWANNSHGFGRLVEEREAAAREWQRIGAALAALEEARDAV